MEILLSIENQNKIIIKEQSIMRLVQDRIQNKINNIELNIKGNNTSCNNGSLVHLDSDFLSKFPLKNSTMYLDVENLTLNDSSFTIKLVRIFYSVLQLQITNYL